jgi:hypothetical protein
MNQVVKRVMMMAMVAMMMVTVVMVPMMAMMAHRDMAMVGHFLGRGVCRR